jgi:hypothetical protein
LNDTLDILKADRTKDQTTIFDLERKLGFLQVHYSYDRAKLMSNSELLEEQMEEKEIKKKAEAILARVQAIVKEIPE